MSSGTPASGPRCAGPLSQITISGSWILSRTASRTSPRSRPLVLSSPPCPHFARFQTDRRVIGGLFSPILGLLESTRAGFTAQAPLGSQLDVARKWASSTKKILAPWACLPRPAGPTVAADKGCPLALGSAFSSRFFGPFDHEPQPVQIVPSTACGSAARSKRSCMNCRTTFQVQLANPDRRRWRGLHRRLQFGLFRRTEGGGEPPLCSTPPRLWPRCWKSACQLAMVRGSRPSASATGRPTSRGPRARGRASVHVR